MSLNESDVQSDYLSRLERIKQLQKELDEKNQEVHVLKNKISLGAVLKAESLDEIEAVRASISENESKHRKELKRLNDTLMILDNKLDAIDQTHIINDLQREKLELQRQIKLVEVANSPKKCALDVEKGEQLKSALIEVQEKFDLLSNEKVSLEAKDNELLKIKNENLVILDTINEQLAETKKETKSLQSEYNSIKLSVSSNTSKPPDIRHQGNSLFAEVHDSELKLKAAITKLENRYVEINSSYHSRLSQVGKLLAKNLELSKELDLIEECDIGDATIKELRAKASGLQLKFESYKTIIKSDFCVKETGLPKYAVDFATASFKEKRDQILEEIDSLNETYIERFNDALTLCKLQQSVRKCARRNLQHKVELDELKYHLAQLESEAPKVTEETKIKIENYSIKEATNKNDLDVPLNDASGISNSNINDRRRQVERCSRVDKSAAKDLLEDKNIKMEEETQNKNTTPACDTGSFTYENLLPFHIEEELSFDILNNGEESTFEASPKPEEFSPALISGDKKVEVLDSTLSASFSTYSECNGPRPMTKDYYMLTNITGQSDFHADLFESPN